MGAPWILPEDTLNDFNSEVEAQKALRAFIKLEKPELRAGDFIKLNRYGRNKYKFPRENQAALVVKVFDKPKMLLTGQDVIVDMIVLMAIKQDEVRYESVNSKYYEKATNKTDKNILGFRKK